MLPVSNGGTATKVETDNQSCCYTFGLVACGNFHNCDSTSPPPTHVSKLAEGVTQYNVRASPRLPVQPGAGVGALLPGSEGHRLRIRETLPFCILATTLKLISRLRG